VTARCVFCDGTGVHDCPGGQLGRDYFRWHGEAFDAPTSFSTHSMIDHAWVAPGALDARCYPKPPAALRIAVLSCPTMPRGMALISQTPRNLPSRALLITNILPDGDDK
jgi:hypothetical protein